MFFGVGMEGCPRMGSRLGQFDFSESNQILFRSFPSLTQIDTMYFSPYNKRPLIR